MSPVTLWRVRCFPRWYHVEYSAARRQHQLHIRVAAAAVLAELDILLQFLDCRRVVLARDFLELAEALIETDTPVDHGILCNLVVRSQFPAPCLVKPARQRVDLLRKHPLCLGGHQDPKGINGECCAEGYIEDVQYRQHQTGDTSPVFVFEDADPDYEGRK